VEGNSFWSKDATRARKCLVGLLVDFVPDLVGMRRGLPDEKSTTYIPSCEKLSLM
jgi:hypothetical protein